jgi:hypothetical protein
LLFLLLLAGAGGALLSIRGEPSPEGQSLDSAFSVLHSPTEMAHNRDDERSWKNTGLVAPKTHFVNAQLVEERARLWLFSSDRLLCLAQPRGAACAPGVEAIKEGLVLGTFQPPTASDPEPHDFSLEGVVPDDVNQVLVVVGKHIEVVVDVKSNIFAIERDRPVHLKRLLRGYGR